VIGGRHGRADETLQIEMRLERRQAAMRVGDQTDPDAGAGQLPQHIRHVIVQLEVLARRPFRIDFAGARVEVRPAAAHLLDDVLRVGDEDLGVVRRLVGAVEQRRGAGHGTGELRGIDVHPVPRAERLVALAAKRRAGVNQREIDVEEDGFRLHGIRG
jgi:hypothetical protein